MKKKALLWGCALGLLLASGAWAQEQKTPTATPQAFVTLTPTGTPPPTLGEVSSTEQPLDGVLTSAPITLEPVQEQTPEISPPPVEGTETPPPALEEGPAEPSPEPAPASPLYWIEWRNAQGQGVFARQITEGLTLRQTMTGEEWTLFQEEEWRDVYATWPEQEGGFLFSFDTPVHADWIFQEPVPRVNQEENEDTAVPEETPPPTEPPATPEPEPWQPQIEISCTYEGQSPKIGDRITLGAKVGNVPVGIEVFLQWQNDSTGEFLDVPGATGLQYTFVLNEENAAWEWRVRLVVRDNR